MPPSDYLSETMEEDLRLGVIDLFSGAGGMSLGFKKAGFDVICGVEIERCAAETYSKNFASAKTFNQDISFVMLQIIKVVLKLLCSILHMH
jgi:DNA (cytosine-5)-methyltransferase 1